MKTIPWSSWEKILDSAKINNKVAAIKEWRAITGDGLKEARDGVDCLDVFGGGIFTAAIKQGTSFTTQWDQYTITSNNQPTLSDMQQAMLDLVKAQTRLFELLSDKLEN